LTVQASAIARLLDVELRGGADPKISGAAPLDRAGPQDLSIVARARYLPYVPGSAAGLLVVTEELADRIPEGRPWVAVASVYSALAVVLPRLYPEPTFRAGVHPTAVVDPDARVGSEVAIGPFAVVGAGSEIGAGARVGAHVAIGEACRIGEGAIIHPQVVLYDRTRIGDRTVIHSGTRLGVDGFGYAPVDGVAKKIPQVGTCIIGSDVEIGANVTVDRGSIGPTEIGDHVKIDNLVQIGHNVRIGAGTIIAAQTGIAGSVRIGRGVTLAGQVGLNGHIQIGDGATIAAQSGVFGDVPAGEVWSGYPARPHREALRVQAFMFRLPELFRRLRRVEGRKDDAQGEE
jgi:UDP-3-O-[3-hydroxymyristoyl] glucosamine N-acyltransferase